MSGISRTERAEIIMLGAGFTNDEIAEKVGVSSSTVSKYHSEFAQEVEEREDPWQVVYGEWVLPAIIDSEMSANIAGALFG